MSAFKATRPALSALRNIVGPAIGRPILATSARCSAPAPAALGFTQVRMKNTSYGRTKWAAKPIIDYKELKPITEQPNDEILLVDVRERDENALGSIPSAVNLPLSELKEALDRNFDGGDFQKRYAFHKPSTTQNIVFFCRSGKRSATAAELAGEKGFHNVRNYLGSYNDWVRRSSNNNPDDDD